jgi:hypothetical protein
MINVPVDLLLFFRVHGEAGLLVLVFGSDGYRVYLDGLGGG